MNRTLEVTTLDAISPGDFVAGFYLPARPVMLRRFAVEWPAVRNWSPAFFAREWGDVRVEVMISRESDPLYELRKRRHRAEMTVREFMAFVEGTDESNDRYMVAKNRVIRRPELAGLLRDLRGWEGVLDFTRLPRGVNLWVGPRGTVTPLHHDRKSLLVVQIVGRKVFSLIHPDDVPWLYAYAPAPMHSPVDPEAPDLRRHPAFARVRVARLELGPADALFLPARWWHHVRATSASFTVAFTCFALPNPPPPSWSC